VPGAGTRRGDAARQRVRYRQPRREMPMFEYQVVPVVVTRGVGVSPVFPSPVLNRLVSARLRGLPDSRRADS
jgi:hypothetical protein